MALGVPTCGLAPGPDASLRALALGALGLEMMLALFAVGGALLSRRPLVERLGLGRGVLSSGSIALLLLGTLSLSLALDGVIEWWGLREGSSLAAFEERLAGARGLDLLVTLAAVGLAPGLCEELLCRGLVQRGLEPRLGAPAAVVLAALLFGALHVDPVHGAFAVLLGLYLGTVAALSGGIRAAVFCHASNNLLAVCFAALWPEAPRPGPAGILAAVALALACLAAVAHRRPPSDLQVEGGMDDP